MSRLNPEHHRAIAAAYGGGETIRQIAARMGLGTNTVSRSLKRQGVRTMPGPRPILGDKPDDRRLYFKIRDNFGAAYARELMGIAA
jgi:hypothetical protein